MVLNMSQTWHQVRPGEVRHDCGGCHAHSQQPTDFALTAAARPDYAVFDLTTQTPLLTDKQSDQSGRQWDVDDTTGLKLDQATVVNVEYHRDVRPILKRSCAGLPLESQRPIPCGGARPGCRRSADRDPSQAKAAGNVLPPGGGPARTIRLQAGDPQRFVAANQRLAIHSQIPVETQFAGLESLWPAPRRLGE